MRVEPENVCCEEKEPNRERLPQVFVVLVLVVMVGALVGRPGKSALLDAFKTSKASVSQAVVEKELVNPPNLSIDVPEVTVIKSTSQLPGPESPKVEASQSAPQASKPASVEVSALPKPEKKVVEVDQGSATPAVGPNAKSEEPPAAENKRSASYVWINGESRMFSIDDEGAIGVVDGAGGTKRLR